MDNPTKIKRILCAEDELKNPHSIFYTYKRLIQYRKQYDVFGDGKYNVDLPENYQNRVCKILETNYTRKTI